MSLGVTSNPSVTNKVTLKNNHDQHGYLGYLSLSIYICASRNGGVEAAGGGPRVLPPENRVTGVTHLGTAERRFIELWWQTKKGAAVTISELVYVMAMEDGIVEGLGLSEKDTSKSLGRFMRGLIGRRFGNVKVHRLDKSRYATYRLDSVE